MINIANLVLPDQKLVDYFINVLDFDKSSSWYVRTIHNGIECVAKSTKDWKIVIQLVSKFVYVELGNHQMCRKFSYDEFRQCSDFFTKAIDTISRSYAAIDNLNWYQSLEDYKSMHKNDELLRTLHTTYHFDGKHWTIAEGNDRLMGNCYRCKHDSGYIVWVSGGTDVIKITGPNGGNMIYNEAKKDIETIAKMMKYMIDKEEVQFTM